MTVTFLKSRHETQGIMDVFEVTIPAHAGSIVPHLHREYEETVLGINCITTWTVDGLQTQVCAGEHQVIPRGATHSFMNLHEQAARILCIPTRPGGAGVLRGACLCHGRAERPMDYTALGVIMTRYGVIPAAL